MRNHRAGTVEEGTKECRDIAIATLIVATLWLITTHQIVAGLLFTVAGGLGFWQLAEHLHDLVTDGDETMFAVLDQLPD